MESTKLKNFLIGKLATFDWVGHKQRAETAELLDVSRPTIDNYINGNVKNLELAERMVFILSQIEKPKKLKAPKETT